MLMVHLVEDIYVIKAKVVGMSSLVVFSTNLKLFGSKQCEY